MSSLLTGDCLEVMAGMEPDSVDAIVTDPPYGLSFMGRAWDHGLPGIPFWTEALRVAKPGAHLLAFGGTRTYHRLACAIEDAGWEIRDCLVWAYASGFPKSLNVAKMIDKKDGRLGWQSPNAGKYGGDGGGTGARPGNVERTEGFEVEVESPDAERWQGWGTALKPAWEPIVMARKPFPGTVAANVLRHGTGALNIDAARIPTDENRARNNHARTDGTSYVVQRQDAFVDPGGVGRWPANLVLTDALFDGDTPGVVGGGPTIVNRSSTRGSDFGNEMYGAGKGLARTETGQAIGYSDTGTYSRFFLVPKASRQDREPNAYGRMVGGLEETEDVRVESAHSTVCAKCGRQRVNVPGAACKCDEPEWVRKPQTARLNSHATVKPIALMRHLVRLVTPPGGTVLDCFAGSGSTLIAAELEGFTWIGIEQEPEYVAIAEARLAGVQRGLGLDVAAPAPKAGKGGGKATGYDWSESVNDNPTHVTRNIKSGVHFGDTGTPSRFFLLPRDPADVA